MRRTIAVLTGLLGLLTAWPAAAQTPPAAAAAGRRAQVPISAPASRPRVRVYLDCYDCFPQYLRDEIRFVDFVRQPQDSDVQLLSRGSDTGGGGREVVLRFIGRGRFQGHDHEHRVTTLVSDTENTRRELILRSVIVGLLDYVVRDGIPPGVNIAVSTEPRQQQTAPAVDPWNLWVFSLRANGSTNIDQTSRERTWRFDYSADRVTEDWKISFGGRINQNHQHFDLDTGDTVDVTRRDRNLNGFVARSFGPHWSAGLRGRAAASTFNNNALSVQVSPAVEFSVFPYDEYATRQLRLQYDVGVERVRYNEVTIYQKLHEVLWQQEASATLDQRQTWGSIRANVQFSQVPARSLQVPDRGRRQRVAPAGAGILAQSQGVRVADP